MMLGMKAAMRPQDNIISAYRVHGWTHLMGVSPEGVLSELTGIQNLIENINQTHIKMFGNQNHGSVNEFMLYFCW